MSSYYKPLLLILAVGLLAVPLRAQPGLRRANAFYEQGAWREAARRYTRILRKNESAEARLHLARCYHKLGRMDEAEKAYSEVVFGKGNLPGHKFELARFLKARGKYKKAAVWFRKFAEESPDPTLGLKWERSCDLALALMQDSLGYKIMPQPVVNSKASEIAPAFYANGIAFASARKRGFFFRFFNRKSKEPFYDLYHAEKGSGGRLRKPQYMRNNMNTKFHDGPTIFSPSEHVAFVTRSRMGEGGKRRDAAGYNRVNIYQVENRLRRWRKAEPVPFNSHEYNVAHPAISRDAGTLFFASDMPGGYGGTDIYVSYLLNDEWTTPENLGPRVNSEANEGFPFLSNDSTLYFSSDRAEGLGGKDIFIARRRKGDWGNVRNAGYPLNTPADDFGFCMQPGNPFGFFASNRAGGKGDDDIYGFRRYKGLDAIVVDAKTGEALEDVKVRVQDINMKDHHYRTNKSGTFRHYLRVGHELMVDVEKADYHPYNATISLRDIGHDENKLLRVRLEEIRRYMVEGKVLDDRTRVPLQNATVRIMGSKERMQFTGNDGAYAQELKPDQEYTAIYYKEGYMPRVYDFNTLDLPEPKQFLIDGELKKGKYILLEGMVRDVEKDLALKGATIHILDCKTQKELQKFGARSDGMFWKVLNHDANYCIIATKNDYLTARYDIMQDELTSDTVQAKFEMVPLEVNKVVKTVYYGYNSSNIDGLGKRDLNEIAYLLLDNPEISVELSSYTDSRGGAAFNKRLSQRRANAAAAYLISRGIDKERIIARGYGEENLYNNCVDGADCSEELHQQNRRTEVKIIRIDEEKQQEKEEKNQ